LDLPLPAGMDSLMPLFGQRYSDSFVTQPCSLKRAEH
jgi:hypothetical protein